MANPPITVGPFTNVPAPGSPIASNWPQTISQWAADQLTAFPAGSGVAQGNVPVGTTVISPLSIPARAVATTWLVLWYWSVSGHVANGTFQPRLRTDAGADVLVGQLDQYLNAQPRAGLWPFRIAKAAGGGPTTYQLAVTLVGASANTNVGGNVHLIGFAT